MTFAASGNGGCYWEQSCDTHNDNTAWKGYRVMQPKYLHTGDCAGREEHLGSVNSVRECMNRCINHYGDQCVYFTFSASGNGGCYWEQSCDTHNDNTAWKGYKVDRGDTINQVPIDIVNDIKNIHNDKHIHKYSLLMLCVIGGVLYFIIKKICCTKRKFNTNKIETEILKQCSNGSVDSQEIEEKENLI